MKQLIINRADLYTINNEEYFKFKYNNMCIVGLHVKLEKNNKNDLILIAKICELDYRGLNKKDLLNLIIDSNCLILD